MRWRVRRASCAIPTAVVHSKHRPRDHLSYCAAVRPAFPYADHLATRPCPWTPTADGLERYRNGCGNGCSKCRTRNDPGASAATRGLVRRLPWAAAFQSAIVARGVTSTLSVGRASLVRYWVFHLDEIPLLQAVGSEDGAAMSEVLKSAVVVASVRVTICRPFRSSPT